MATRPRQRGPTHLFVADVHTTASGQPICRCGSVEAATVHQVMARTVSDMSYYEPDREDE